VTLPRNMKSAPDQPPFSTFSPSLTYPSSPSLISSFKLFRAVDFQHVKLADLAQLRDQHFRQPFAQRRLPALDLRHVTVQRGDKIVGFGAVSAKTLVAAKRIKEARNLFIGVNFSHTCCRCRVKNIGRASDL